VSRYPRSLRLTPDDEKIIKELRQMLDINVSFTDLVRKGLKTLLEKWKQERGGKDE